MPSEITTGRVLIVEDEKDKRQGLVRILMVNGGFSGNHIKDVSNSTDAIKAINDFEPKVVILDLKIPRDKNEEPKIENSASVLKEIELYNSNNLETIYVVVISASIQDSGIQSLIKEDRSKIITFIDKNDAAIDTDKFIKKLITHVRKALSRENSTKCISYASVRKSGLKELKEINPKLWQKIDNNILSEFESLFNKYANIHPRAKQIIGSCGEVVEDIIFLLSDDSYSLTEKKYKDFNPTVGETLYALTGRKKGKEQHSISLTGKPALLSRASAEYAYQAYRYRSEALHSSDNDLENKRLFKEKKLTQEDAGVSISLILPIILEYIEIVKNKNI